MYFEHALVKINSGWSKNADRFWNQSCMELTSSNDYFIVSLHLIISNMRPDEFFDESSVLIILSPLIYVHCFTYLLAKTNFPSDFGQTTKFSRYKIKLSLTKYTTVHYNIQTILNLNKKSDLKTQKAQTQPTKKKKPIYTDPIYTKWWTDARSAEKENFSLSLVHAKNGIKN